MKPESIGLCERCQHSATQPNAKGSVFWRCRLADTDPRFLRYPPLPVRECPGFEEAGDGTELASGPMQTWFIVSAVGNDRPGLVADLARLIYDSDANLEDSRMTQLGSDFAIILLCSARSPEAGERLAMGAKRLERDHGLVIHLRSLEGERPPLPVADTRSYRLEAAGEDKAGIVASLCRVLADRGVNIAELSTRSRPGPGGSPHYEMTVLAQVPEHVDVRQLREELEREGDRLVIDVSLMPVL